jgi:hypothetical protein
MLDEHGPGQLRCFIADPDFDPDRCPLRFRLTYEGPLYSASKKNANTQHKHFLRKHFHKQLKHLWQTDPLLKNWLRDPSEDWEQVRRYPKNEFELKLSKTWRSWIEVLPEQFPAPGGFAFVPLITQNLALECGLHIVMLRSSTTPGETADLDNRLKTLFDALTFPKQPGQIPVAVTPDADEKPMFCLLSDDGLVDKLDGETGELLEPVNVPDYPAFDPAVVRLIIHVLLRPKMMTIANSIFSKDYAPFWEHRQIEDISATEKLKSLSTTDLRVRVSQIAQRLRSAQNVFSLDQSRLLQSRVHSPEGWQLHQQRSADQMVDHAGIWQNELRPHAFALYEEMLRRIHATPPYPDDWNDPARAVQDGLLAGPRALDAVALKLESLARQLPD